jgi:hypothetical protein
MWNGDGKTVVMAFRIDFFRKFAQEHPECRLDHNDEYWQLYDCVDEIPGEDLDCWYCDECKGLTVFVDISRYDFKLMYVIPSINMEEILSWEEYIALREHDFEKFQDFYEGMKPLEAIESYSFKYKYRVSPDKKIIYAIDSECKVVFGYQRSNYYEFSPNLEITFKSENSETNYKPYNYQKERIDITVRVKQYAHTKDGRTIIIDEIIDAGKLYRGRDINVEGLPIVELKHEDIFSLSEEI